MTEYKSSRTITLDDLERAPFDKNLNHLNEDPSIVFPILKERDDRAWLSVKSQILKIDQIAAKKYDEHTLEVIKLLHSSRVTVQSIMKYLKTHGYPNQKGSTWRINQVADILYSMDP